MDLSPYQIVFVFGILIGVFLASITIALAPLFEGLYERFRDFIDAMKERFRDRS